MNRSQAAASAVARSLAVGLLLLVLITTLQCANGQESSGSSNPATATTTTTTTQTCPAYRFLDTTNPTTPIYGAPDGCRCFLGLSGLNCGYCDNDDPCQLQNGGSAYCRKDFVPDITQQTYVAYKCRLYNRLGSLFTNGKASFYLDLNTNTTTLSLFDTRSVNDNRTVDCELTGCDFTSVDKTTTCQSMQCNCNENECNPWIEQIIVNNNMNNRTANIVANPIPPAGREDHRVTVWVEGLPFIEASCTARACAATAAAASSEGGQDSTINGGTGTDLGGGTNTQPTFDINDFFGPSEDEPAEQTAAEDRDEDPGKGSAELSLIVLAIFCGIFLVVLVFALIPFLFGTQSCDSSNSSTKDYVPPGHDDDEPQQQEVEESTTAAAASKNKHILQFQNLTRTIQLKGAAANAYGQKDKIILNDISGSVESGTMLGIMGQSGAGKSSLLNVLAAVETVPRGQAKVSGHIMLNGKEPGSGYRRAVAYVHQDDALYGTLTVLECIEYSAMMRLPNRTMTMSEKQTLVWKTLQELQLTDIAHNRIGTNSGHASISGGQRKRVSIGMELVAMPTVLALDEPTSGLDSTAANKIMKVLSNLALRNRIIILSIHQPSMKSFLMMDQILLLGNGGRVVYNGKPSSVKGHLEERGFVCPEDETIADYMLDVVSDEANLKVLRDAEAKSSTTAAASSRQPPPTSSKDSSEEPQNNNDNVDHLYEELSTESGSVSNEITTLFARTARDTFRNMELFLMQVTISILLGCFAGAIFNDVSNDLAGFQNRMGAFYFSLSFFGFASFSSMDIFVKERHIFERETGAKMYRAFSYFVAKTVLDVFVLRVVPVTIFSFVFYWLMGLNSDFEKFVVFWATMVLFNVCAGIISICISIAAPTVGQANLIAVVWFLIMLLFGGFLINVDSMASWYSWLKYLSIYYYAFELLITNELSGLLLKFDAPGFPTVPVFGEVFVETLGMDVDNQIRDILCLCCLAAGYSLLAYLFLLLRVPPSAATYFSNMQAENSRLTQNPTMIRGSFNDEEGATTPPPTAGANGENPTAIRSSFRDEEGAATPPPPAEANSETTV